MQGVDGVECGATPVSGATHKLCNAFYETPNEHIYPSSWTCSSHSLVCGHHLYLEGGMSFMYPGEFTQKDFSSFALYGMN
jgi:hypothetical protein